MRVGADAAPGGSGVGPRPRNGPGSLSSAAPQTLEKPAVLQVKVSRLIDDYIALEAANAQFSAGEGKEFAASAAVGVEVGGGDNGGSGPSGPSVGGHSDGIGGAASSSGAVVRGPEEGPMADGLLEGDEQQDENRRRKADAYLRWGT